MTELVELEDEGFVAVWEVVVVVVVIVVAVLKAVMNLFWLGRLTVGAMGLFRICRSIGSGIWFSSSLSSTVGSSGVCGRLESSNGRVAGTSVGVGSASAIALRSNVC